MDDKELLADLVAESKDHLNEIEPDLLAMEAGGGQPSEELVNRLFRAMHSIKGGFSFLGLTTIARLAHTMETALGRVRDGEIPATPDLIDALLKGTDKVNSLLDEAETSESASIEAEEKLLAPFLPGADGGETDNTEIDDEEMAKLFDSASSQPAEPSVADTTEPETVAPSVPEQPEPVAPAPVKSPEPPATPPPSKDAKKVSKSSGSGDTIRIKVDLLDRLMNLAGELVLARNQISSVLDRGLWDIVEQEPILREMEKSIGKNGADGKGINNIIRAFPPSLAEAPAIKLASQQIDLVTSELQESIMKTRLQPVGAVFGKLPRLIRDISRNLGKQIRLELKGEDVELDKSMVELLGDPLVHIIRNCGDHAIEQPEERLAVGKKAEGLVQVTAEHEGGQVHITITDDGRGIDPVKIKEKALSKGLITEEEAAAMSDPEAQKLIFHPGFSTAEVVSDLSGRGVGMDVVRTNVESLGGSVELVSVPGSGSQFTLKLPLTMAIIHSLIIRVGDRRFAIPQSYVEEFTRIRQKDIGEMVETVGTSAVIRRRGKLLPLVRLSEILEIDSIYQNLENGAIEPERRQNLIDRRNSSMENAGWRKEFNLPDSAEKDRTGTERRENLSSAMQIVVLKVDTHRYGLIVDAIDGIEETVVKPLSGYFKNISCYSGATIMGDGRVTIILDPIGLASSANLSFEMIEENDADIEKDKKGERGHYEVQRLLMFTNGTEEMFAVNIDLIDRIDRVKYTSFSKVGDKRFHRRGDQSLRVLNLHDYLAVNKPAEIPEDVMVLTPKLVRHPMGIIAHEVIDVVDSNIEIDRNTLSGPGIFSSGIQDGKLVIFIDLYNILEQADPELYKNRLDDIQSFEGKKVLLAEDTAFFRTLTVKYMKEQGFSITAVEDGVEALRELEGGGTNYDLLLTDINMPHMNGFELTRRVRALSGPVSKMPIVALTSMALDKDREEGFSSGVDYYELKLDKERLIHVLHDIFMKVKR